MTLHLLCNGQLLDLNSPKVMGILNVTPDSFSDGGFFVSADKALQRAEQMVLQGAAIIDVGGESTRPGASAVSVQEELDRVIPIVEKIHRNLSTIISVDTSKAAVMRAAVEAGAGMINDVRALQDEGALDVARDLGVPICLMHMQGEPRVMQKNPIYSDVVQDVYRFLEKRVTSCIEVGIARNRLLVDPGFGFGKNLKQNLQLLKHLSDFRKLKLPLLVGMSRKSMLGMMLNRTVQERLAGSISLATLALAEGASIIRAHDVAETLDAIVIREHLNRI